MRIRTLIVEDESWVRKGIVKMIRWKEHGMVLIGEATNGEEALRHFPAESPGDAPDLVITDMLMPAMDGLQFLQRLESLKPDCEFVVLSGYADYPYMKQAIHSGVHEYLLKPVDEEELNRVLARVAVKIRDKKKERDAHKQLAVRQAIRRLFGGDPPPPAAELPAPVNRLLQCPYCAAIGILLKEQVKRDTGWQQLEELAKPPGEYTPAVFFAASDQEGYVVLGGDQPAGGRMSAGQHRMVKRTLEWGENLQGGLRIGVSEWKAGPGGARQAYEEARQLLRYQRTGAQDIVFPDDVRMSEGRSDLQLMEEPQLALLIEKGKYRETEQLLAAFFRDVLKERIVKLADLRKAVLEWFLALERCCHRLATPVDPGGEIGEDYPGRIETLHSVEALRDWTIAAFRKTADRLEEENADRKDVVGAIQAYIESHYHEDIHLITLAQKHFVNHIYLSRLFKQQTGENFIDYLTRVRMTKAKALLAEGNLKIREVAEMVGYANPYYFSKSYKKYFASEKGETES